ncbi:MAG: hypothetical protein U0610_01980 [bacterium]
MTTLKELLANPGVRLAEVTKHLDGLSRSERILECMTLDRRAQERLWQIAEHSQPLDLDYLLPSSAEPLDPYPFEGKNSLPVFTRFQKVFYKTQEGTIGGYNNSSVGPVVGPGYYVTHLWDARPGELAVDYLQVPKSKPAAWPPIKPNDVGVSQFVYGGMVDFLRWVSDDVVIGRAYKKGQDPMPNWFVLCRTRPRA